jgi:3-oxoacyl-[acyl-carrier-protein] synthase III
MTVHLAGLGTYLPHRIVTNETLSAFSGLDAAWIYERTHAAHRHLAHFSTTHMATMAGSVALSRAGVKPEEIGLLAVVSNYHQSIPFLSTASEVKAKLGLTKAAVVDICTPYTGFLTALQLGAAAVEEQGAPALIIGAEGFSDATKLKDRRTCYLFSDGAGALVLASKGKYARLGEVVQGHLQPPPTDTRWECALPTRAGRRSTWRAFKQALELVSPRLGGETIHVPSQWLEPENGDCLPPIFKLARPLGDTADFISASLPLALYHFLRGQNYADGDKLILFGSDGLTSWNLCVLDSLCTKGPCWEDNAAAPAEQETERVHPLEGERAVVRLCPGAELQQSIEQVLEHAVEHHAEVVCLAIQLDEQLSESAHQEATRLLASQIRATDILFKQSEAPAWALLLKYINQADAERLATRLKWLLETLDPAGELEVPVQIEVLTAEQQTTPAVLASRLVQILHQRK